MSSAFEDWLAEQRIKPAGEFALARLAWDAATEAERDRCAKIVEGIYEAFKWSAENPEQESALDSAKELLDKLQRNTQSSTITNI